jgi:hypothetical protein
VNLLPAAQPIPATPPAHGLLASATEATDLDFEPTEPGADRWGNGFAVNPENCVEVTPWEPDCEYWPTAESDGRKGAAAAKSDPATNELTYNIAPVVLETAFECKAHGFLSVDYRGRARRQMEAATSKGMESELATGALNQAGSAINPYLEDAGSVTVLESGSTFSPQDAMLLLGQALSNCGHGGKGMIHAPTIWVDKLLDEGSANIKEVGNRLVTVGRGDTIVSGTGYPGRGPGGSAPATGRCYVYATGPVQYRLSDVIVFPDTMSEALDRAKNEVEYRAERMVAMNFDPCCHFVVESTGWAALP